jgi:hypothetical protein
MPHSLSISGGVPAAAVFFGAKDVVRLWLRQNIGISPQAATILSVTLASVCINIDTYFVVVILHHCGRTHLAESYSYVSLQKNCNLSFVPVHLLIGNFMRYIVVFTFCSFPIGYCAIRLRS